MTRRGFRPEKGYVSPSRRKYESISLSPSFISSPPAPVPFESGDSPFSVAPARRRAVVAPLVVTYLASRQVFLIFRHIGRSRAQSPFSDWPVAPPTPGASGGGDRTGRRGRRRRRRRRGHKRRMSLSPPQNTNSLERYHPQSTTERLLSSTPKQA